MLGKLLQGRYQVVQVLNAGGFGHTYLARDTCLPSQPTCVVKHLKSASNHPASVQTARRLFTREAQALKKLGDHDHIPQLYAHFEENQEFYLVQEFISGHPLSEELLPGSRWSESQVVQMLQEVLGILEFVHSHGLIHRDIKPSNLIRQKRDGRLVLVDFGSVKLAWTQVVTAQGQTSATVANGIPATIAIGTPGYMPTEQGRGRPRPNSDIYALGMIGIQALTGLHPTELLEDSDTGEFIWQHQAFVSAELAGVLNKMVRYHFKDRYQSATEALQALQPLTNLYPQLPKAGVAGGTRGDKRAGGAEGRAQGVGGECPEKLSYVHSPPASPAPLRAPQRGKPPQLTRSPASPASPAPKASRHFAKAEEPPHATGSPASKASKASKAPKAPLALEAPALGHSKASRRKSALLIGIGTGVATAIALTLGIYYSLRSSAPASKVQQNPVSTPSKNTSQALTLTGHSDPVWSVTISPDGKTLVSSSGDKTIKIWNLPTQELRRTLTGHSGEVLSVAISPDGQTLASSSWDKTIKIWNLPTQELRRTLTGRSNEVWSVAISPDGQNLVSGSGDTNKIWNLPTQKLRRTLTGHSDTVWSVAISPDGQTLASGSKDQTIKIWDLLTGEVKSTLSGHSGRVRSLAFSPNGQTLASGSWDQTIKIWNLRTGKLLRTLTGHSAYVNSVAISPDGQILASGSDDSTIKLWNLHSGELLRTLTGHSGNVNSVTFGIDGKILGSGSGDKTIKIWRL